MRPLGRILRTADFLLLRGGAWMRLMARCTCGGRHFSCFAKKSNQKKATPAAQVIALRAMTPLPPWKFGGRF